MDKQISEEALVSCDICCKEVPKSVAKTPESTDYVVYFCGLECYEKWRQDGEKAVRPVAEKK